MPGIETGIEICRSEIVESCPDVGMVKTVDGETHRISAISIIDDIGTPIVQRSEIVVVPYSGDEEPLTITKGVPSQFRQEMPA